MDLTRGGEGKERKEGTSLRGEPRVYREPKGPSGYEKTEENSNTSREKG